MLRGLFQRRRAAWLVESRGRSRQGYRYGRLFVVCSIVWGHAKVPRSGSENPATPGKAMDLFPDLTTGDMVRAQKKLLDFLELKVFTPSWGAWAACRPCSDR